MPSMSRPLTQVQEIVVPTSHEVFICFRGEDTRQGFVSHLHSALERKSIKTYMDDRDLERGNEISPTLLRAIEQSKISLIVFSENFASSRWTLDEVVTIMACRRTRGQLVLPIFYRISPSEVRHQNLSRSGMTETEQQRTAAMAEAADLAGWESSTFRTESELVEVIVMEVMRKLKRKCLFRLHGGIILGILRDALFLKEHERLYTPGCLYRNPYVAERDQLWWEIQHEHVANSL